MKRRALARADILKVVFEKKTPLLRKMVVDQNDCQKPQRNHSKNSFDHFFGAFFHSLTNCRLSDVSDVTGAMFYRSVFMKTSLEMLRTGGNWRGKEPDRSNAGGNESTTGRSTAVRAPEEPSFGISSASHEALSATHLLLK